MTDVLETPASMGDKPPAEDLPDFMRALARQSDGDVKIAVEWLRNQSALSARWAFDMRSKAGSFLLSPEIVNKESVNWAGDKPPDLLEAVRILDALTNVLDRLDRAMGVSFQPAELLRTEARTFALALDVRSSDTKTRLLLSLPPDLTAATWLKHGVEAPVPEELLNAYVDCLLQFSLPSLAGLETYGPETGDLILLQNLGERPFSLIASDSGFVIDGITSTDCRGTDDRGASPPNAPRLLLGPIELPLQTLMELQSSQARQLPLPAPGCGGRLQGAIAGHIITATLHTIGDQFALEVQKIDKEGTDGSE